MSALPVLINTEKVAASLGLTLQAQGSARLHEGLTAKGLAALEYARRGWKVFPCQPAGKEPLIAKKDGGKGHKDATDDLATVRSWWLKNPDANIGLNLKASSLVAVDADSYKHDCGWTSFARAHDIPHTFVQRSPRGGTHYIFADGGEEYAGRIGECPGVDIKHDGYILLDPSTFADAVYRVETDDDPAPAPDWVPRKATNGNDAATPGQAPRTVIDRPAEDYSALCAEARDMLKHATNDLSRDDWVKLALALKAEFGNDVRKEFIEFSYRWPDKKDGDPERVWDTATPGGEAGFGTVRHLLRPRDARRVDDGFDANGMAVPGHRRVASAVTKYAPNRGAERRSQFYSAAELEGKNVPAREWLVPELVPMNTVTLLSGDGGTGKSLLALMLAAAVAPEGSWLNKDVRHGHAVFLSAEDDDDELHRRLADIVRTSFGTFTDLERLTLRSLAGEDALLAIEANDVLRPSALFEGLERRVADEAPALVVLDTLADMFPSNENDRVKVRQFVGILRGLALRQRCAVLLLSHPSLTGINSGTGMSGSTAWNNSVRSRMYLERVFDEGYEPDADKRILVTKKSNYGRAGNEIIMKWQGGVFVAEAEPSSVELMMAGAKAERVFLELLDEFTAQGRPPSPSPSGSYAPTQFAKHPNAKGIKKAQFVSAMDTLLSRGVIEILTSGPPSRLRQQIARVRQTDDDERKGDDSE